MCDLNQQSWLIQHIQDQSLISPSVSLSTWVMFTSPTWGTLRRRPWVASFLWASNELRCSEPFSSLAHCNQQEPPLSSPVSKNNVFFVSKNPWYVLAHNSKNSAFSPCPPKPSFAPTAHFVFLCTPLSSFLSLPLPVIFLGLGIMPVSQVHYPDCTVFVSWKSGVSVSLCSDQSRGLKFRHNSPRGFSKQSGTAFGFSAWIIWDTKLNQTDLRWPSACDCLAKGRSRLSSLRVPLLQFYPLI